MYLEDSLMIYLMFKHIQGTFRCLLYCYMFRKKMSIFLFLLKRTSCFYSIRKSPDTIYIIIDCKLPALDTHTNYSSLKYITNCMSKRMRVIG